MIWDEQDDFKRKMGLRKVYSLIVEGDINDQMTRNQFTAFVEGLNDITEVEKDPVQIEHLWKLFNNKNGDKISFEQFLSPGGDKLRNKKGLDLSGEKKKKKSSK